MIAYGKKQLHSLSDILFLGDWRWGAALAAVVLWSRPWLMAGGLTAAAAALALRHGLGEGAAAGDRTDGVAVNAFLIGLAAAAIFDVSAGGLVVAAGAGAASLAATALVQRVVQRSGLPVLSLPFALTALLLMLASGRTAAMGAAGPAPAGPGMTLLPAAVDYCRALGAVVFLPTPAVGAVMAVGILCRSRILFLLSGLGYAAAEILSPAPVGAAVGFNGILAAMAIGGVFMVPSRRSLLRAALGAALAVPAVAAAQMILDRLGLPVLTLPFVAATWAALSIGPLTGGADRPLVRGATPEALLENNVLHRLRFPIGGPAVHPPFAGTWTVWQGIDGPWTHRGPWRYAFDFVVVDDRGRMHAGEGNRVTDYHAFGKPVLSPVSGRVVAVVNDVPDNPIGRVDQQRRWGNLVMIAHPDGVFVEISHLAAGSAAVCEGQWVSVGAVLGQCGNSGYSPVPHIHIQVQALAVVGAASVPFRFAGCLADGEETACAVPAAGQRVQAHWPAPEMTRATDLRLGETFHLSAAGARKTVSTQVRVTMDDDGAACLATDAGRLYYSRRDDGLTFDRVTGTDPLLMAVFTAVPFIPHACTAAAVHRDWVPARPLVAGWRAGLLALAGVWFPEAVALRTRSRFVAPRIMETRAFSLPAGVDARVRMAFGRGRLFHRLEADGQVITLTPEAPDAPVTPAHRRRSTAHVETSVMQTINGIIAAMLVFVLGSGVANAADLPYTIVDTGQRRTFDTTEEIVYPAPGTAFDGQDAQYRGRAAAYRDNGDGTVSDLNTGLMWVKTPDFRNKKTFTAARAEAADCRVGGYADWRLPTVKELYSLIDFNGYAARTEAQSRPYIDTSVFDFAYGDPRRGERLIDAQYASGTVYAGRDGAGKGGKLFGVNFADGRIKGYDLKVRGREKTFYVRYVRGNPAYGRNDFVDNGDGTVTDRATGLMWMTADSGRAMDWESALAYAESLTLAGHDDWRLPDAKELQSIVDYSRAPDARDPARRGPAIDPIFDMHRTESWFWTGTTHLDGRTAANAVYVAFGRAYGTIRGHTVDVHGAGAQRSDPKTGDPGAYAGGRGPQGDDIRITNYVRCVRGGAVVRQVQGPALDPALLLDRPGGGPGGAPAVRGGFVARLDRDGDGRVSLAEFDGPAVHFIALDRNHDGGIDDGEAPKGPPRAGPAVRRRR